MTGVEPGQFPVKPAAGPDTSGQLARPRTRREIRELARQANAGEAKKTPAAPTSAINTAVGTATKPAPRTRPPLALRLVGWCGEILVTAGVLVGLFVVWQLYWTTYEADQKKAAAVEQFQAVLLPAPAAPTLEKRYDAPPQMPAPAAGKVFGLLRVPSWGENAMPIAQGIGQDVLNRAYAGHYPKTQLPGEIGNFAVAGHRRTYGNNFRLVHQLKQGDPIVVETEDSYLVYRVSSWKIVLPTQVDVIAPVPGDPQAAPTERLLTMTTCDPEYGNSHRYIVHSKLDYWIPRSAGTPPELEGKLS